MDKTALDEAVRDVLWRAQRYGQAADGDTAHYIVTKGAMHRLIGAAQRAGIPASFRADDTAELPDETVTLRRDLLDDLLAATKDNPDGWIVPARAAVVEAVGPTREDTQ